MIVPSIDLQGGQAVQLIGGEKLAIEAGDPTPIAERFARVGEIAVIDLDAAIGGGANRERIQALCASYPCRVGGGIRDEQTARAWLDAGARKIILGTAAQPELLRKLPRDRVIAALDAVHGEVVTHGWRTRTGVSIEDRMRELREHVGGFLITFVEREGRLQGTAMDRVAPLVALAGDARVTIAGGVSTAQEIADLDALGADAQVGMALYTGRISLAEAFAAPLRSDRPDGLWSTVVVDPHGRALGQCYSNLQSLTRALETGRGVYWSRSRGLWEKGATSGAVQELLAVDLDCDRDTLRMTVRQTGAGFCHLGTSSCWGALGGLPALAHTLQARVHDAPAGSYTRRLLDDPALLRSKLLEEASELAAAEGAEEVTWEAADVLYFAMVAMARAGVRLEDVEQHLERRALRVSRREGHAKPIVDPTGAA
jgi:phosphoribosyl-ATP pyrophosphohydrolase/phosphoribosyl-AMP cyclohydrolase